jgi:hypothetical protein
VQDAIRDWLAYGLSGRATTIAANYATIAQARIIAPLGRRRLRYLSAEDVDRWRCAQAKAVSIRTLRHALDTEPRRHPRHGPRQGQAQRGRALRRPNSAASVGDQPATRRRVEACTRRIPFLVASRPSTRGRRQPPPSRSTSNTTTESKLT